MKIESLTKFYGVKEQIAGALGVSVQTIINWQAKGKIPMPAQRRIETISRGELKADKVKK